MNRTEFQNLCTENNIDVIDAGKDWNDALVRAAYLCAIIRDADDFEKMKPLIDSEQAVLSIGMRKDGQEWFEYSGYTNIFTSNAQLAARDMADNYATFLNNKDNIVYYTTANINRRNELLAQNGALEDEDAESHFCRVAAIVEDNYDEYGWITPLYVTEPGYWHCHHEDLLLAERELDNGIWYYRYDNWERRIILVLKEDEED